MEKKTTIFQDIRKKTFENFELFREKMWTCVEDRIENGTKLGKVIKKVIFGDIFADRNNLFKNNPLTVEFKKYLQVRFS